MDLFSLFMCNAVLCQKTSLDDCLDHGIVFPAPSNDPAITEDPFPHRLYFNICKVQVSNRLTLELTFKAWASNELILSSLLFKQIFATSSPFRTERERKTATHKAVHRVCVWNEGAAGRPR